MVYRGTWGRNPEKKGEDAFPSLLSVFSLLYGTRTNLGREPVSASCSGADTFGDLGACSPQIQAYTPTDVLGRSPAADVLDVRYPQGT